MSNRRANPVEDRDDVSRFIVHLTRDDSGDFRNGGSAKQNLRSMLKQLSVLAIRPHCMHNEKMKLVPTAKRDAFKVACFTETPLTQLHRLVGYIPGRKIRLEAYGIVFHKESLVRQGAQPAIYINSYQNQMFVRDGADALFDAAVNGGFKGKSWRLLPYMNAMHEKYDFAWEREWRTCGAFKFKASDVVCIILPETGEEKYRDRLNSKGIACISPGWSYERIVKELASQHRATAAALKAVGGQATSTKHA